KQRDRAEHESYSANLQAAQSLIASADYEDARERLFRCAPRLRGWEWRFLYAQSDTSAAILHGAGDSGLRPSLRLSADGRRIYYVMERTVHAWDIPSWQPVANYGIFGAILGSNSDASLAVTRTPGLPSNDLLIVEPLSGKTVARLPGHGDAIQAVFSSDGSR